jgi:hypothetical protein
MSFSPAMSNKARKAVGQKIRAWHLNRRSGTDLSGLAREINPQTQGWANYYGAFYRSGFLPIAKRIDEHLVRWAMQKFKRLRGKHMRAWDWLNAVRQRRPDLFAHWRFASAAFNRLWEPYDGRPSRTVLREPGVRSPRLQWIRVPPQPRTPRMRRAEETALVPNFAGYGTTDPDAQESSANAIASATVAARPSSYRASTAEVPRACRGSARESTAPWDACHVGVTKAL